MPKPQETNRSITRAILNESLYGGNFAETLACVERLKTKLAGRVLRGLPLGAEARWLWSVWDYILHVGLPQERMGKRASNPFFPELMATILEAQIPPDSAENHQRFEHYDLAGRVGSLRLMRVLVDRSFAASTTETVKLFHFDGILLMADIATEVNQVDFVVEMDRLVAQRGDPLLIRRLRARVLNRALRFGRSSLLALWMPLCSDMGLRDLVAERRGLDISSLRVLFKHGKLSGESWASLASETLMAGDSSLLSFLLEAQPEEAHRILSRADTHPLPNAASLVRGFVVARESGRTRPLLQNPRKSSLS
jgi:hypothetical protein